MQKKYETNEEYDLSKSINGEFKRAFDLLKELCADCLSEKYYTKTRDESD